LAAVGQGSQREPQVAVAELLTHCPLQSWNPSLQRNPHWPFPQVAVALAAVGQGSQRAPQVAVAELLTHASPH
jgi:hypothetical protein